MLSDLSWVFGEMFPWPQTNIPISCPAAGLFLLPMLSLHGSGSRSSAALGTQ